MYFFDQKTRMVFTGIPWLVIRGSQAFMKNLELT